MTSDPKLFPDTRIFRIWTVISILVLAAAILFGQLENAIVLVVLGLIWGLELYMILEHLTSPSR